MQQTETYKLNKPETTDPFTPTPLNENADKLEAALLAEAAARQALDGRVQVLEAERVVVGTYTGSGQSGGMFVDLGFTPKAVIVASTSSFNFCSIIAPGAPNKQNQQLMAEVVEGGFRVYRNQNFEDLHIYWALT